MKRGTEPPRGGKMPVVKDTHANPQPLLKPFAFEGWDYQIPSLGMAEYNAQLADVSENGELAAWWRRLKDYTEEEAKQVSAICERDGRNAIDTLLAQAEKFDGPLFPLWQLLYRSLTGLHALAAHGNELAGRYLMNAVSLAVSDFEMLATTKPDIFHKWARESFGIPGIISPSKEKTADNQRLVKQLHVGEDYHFSIHATGKRGNKWKFQKQANGLAARLHSYIEENRTLYEVHRLQGQHYGHSLPTWLHRAAKLKPFSATTWRDWAGIGWDILLEGV